MTKDPTRLVDDPSAPALLREDLRSAIDNPPQIPLPPTPPVPGWTPLAAGLATLALLAVGGLMALLLWPGEPERASAPPAPPVRHSAIDAAAPRLAVVPLDGGIALPPVDEASPAEEEREPEPVARVRGRDRVTEPTPSVADEVAHMAELRRIARSQPARALAMARDGERRFREGLFSEERRAIEVLSLYRLGRTAAARRQARRFLERYPNSTQAGVVRPILAGPSAPNGAER